MLTFGKACSCCQVIHMNTLCMEMLKIKKAFLLLNNLISFFFFFFFPLFKLVFLFYHNLWMSLSNLTGYHCVS